MITLRCAPPDTRATEVRIGQGLVAREAAELARDGRTTALLFDEALKETVADLPAAWLRLPRAGGEGAKTFTVLEQILRQLARHGLDRNGRLFVLGGGSIGDLGGLVASLYLRGIEHIQAPTTMLAMVDSAIGGKNALNLAEGKNLVGTIWPPSLVLGDIDLLRSLSTTEYLSGLAEVLKAGLGFSPSLFSLLETKADAVLAREPRTLLELVAAAIAAKIRIVELDPSERGPRRVLNLGHTLGHALEASSGYRMPHGFAVARGLHFALKMARVRDAVAPRDADRMEALLVRYGFHCTPLPEAADLAPYLRRDKKAEGARVNFVLPVGIGISTVETLPTEMILAQL